MLTWFKSSGVTVFFRLLVPFLAWSKLMELTSVVALCNTISLSLTPCNHVRNIWLNKWKLSLEMYNIWEKNVRGVSIKYMDGGDARGGVHLMCIMWQILDNLLWFKSYYFVGIGFAVVFMENCFFGCKLTLWWPEINLTLYFSIFSIQVTYFMSYV